MKTMENEQMDYSVYLCKKCGVMLEAGQGFCPQCGTQRGSDGKENAILNNNQVNTVSNGNEKKPFELNKKSIIIIASIVVVLLILIFILIFAFSKKNVVNGNENTTGIESSSGDALSSAKEAYASLNIVTSYSAVVIGDVSSVWGWCIFDADDEAYNDVSVNIARESNLSSEEVAKAYEDLYGSGKESYSSYSYILLEDWQYAVPTVIRAYINNGYYQATEDELNSAKDKIHALTGDEPYYEDLKNYYTEVLNFRDFSFSPTGNYQNLSSTVNDHVSKIDTLKSNLSFDLE